MQVLLSTIGSRGDVQPLVALGMELQAMGHRARLCVAPNFKEWVESFGLECVPIGLDLRKLASASTPVKPAAPTKEQLQQMADQSVRDQFQIIGAAAQGCDLIVAATALQIAASSIAEQQAIPYVYAAYCPAVLPSLMYPPPKTGGSYSFSLGEAANELLWKDNEQEFNARFGAALNEERVKLGLDPGQSVRDSMFTNHPWLAADLALAPAYPPAGLEIVQTGAWILPDPSPLSDELEKFLAAGPAPIYLGFGSLRASEQTGELVVDAARRLGLRAILQQGFANPAAGNSENDFIWIGDVNYEKLLPRVAAIVHHGGAGTTTAAARAGIPQVIIPHHYDQFYFAHRIEQLGVGVEGPMRDDLTVDTLTLAIEGCLQPEVTARAKALASQVELHGASIAAERLAEEYG